MAVRSLTDDLVQQTRAHYESFPFVEGGSRRVAHWRRRLRGLSGSESLDGLRVLDVGCGSGEISRQFVDRGGSVVAIDLTSAAVQRARVTSGGAATCQGSALALPFDADSFHLVVSIGVLHHTPDCRAALAELHRVTAPSGRVIVLIYGRLTPYHFVYTISAPLRRWLPVERLHRIPRPVLGIMRVLVWLQRRAWLEDAQLKRLLADQLWTPTATFHSASQIQRWARELGLSAAGRKYLVLHANILAFDKRTG